MQTYLYPVLEPSDDFVDYILPAANTMVFDISDYIFDDDYEIIIANMTNSPDYSVQVDFVSKKYEFEFATPLFVTGNDFTTRKSSIKIWLTSKDVTRPRDVSKVISFPKGSNILMKISDMETRQKQLRIKLSRLNFE